MNNLLTAIDIGTNSFHLVVVRIDSKGGFKILDREKDVIRLGKSPKDMKYISDEAKDRAVECLKRYKLVAKSFKSKIRAVATSAVREALNKEEFIDDIYMKTGIKIEVVSGFEEARLIYLGVLQALPVFNKKILLIDIGGGSTEFLVGEKGEVIFADSVKAGAVRLTEGFPKINGFNKKSIEEARIYARSLIHPVVRRVKEYEYETVVGTSGTITNIGSIIYNKVNDSDENDFLLNNYSYRKSDLKEIVELIIKSRSVENLKKINGLDPQRADIIIAGAIILEQIFELLDIKKITISNYALREGIILDSINKDSGYHNLNTDIRRKSILSLAKQCNSDEIHCTHVLKLALKLFDFISLNYPGFNLSLQDRELLESAALIHDIGHSISHNQHHRHSYYLIKNSELLGFNFEEIDIIANVSRYHRKSHPKIKHENFSRLSSDAQERIRKLAGILRIADGLDRSHNANVKDFEINKTGDLINIKIIPEEECLTDLEIWGANLRKELFEKAFEIKIKIEL